MNAAVQYNGLGGSIRLESGEYHGRLNKAYQAGQIARMQGSKRSCKGVRIDGIPLTATERSEFFRGFDFNHEQQ